MVVCRSTSEIKVAVAPARFFKALFLDSRNILPKVVPQSIKSIDIVQGQAGAAGCVEQINFPDGSPFKYIKNRVDHIDEQSLVCKYTMIEGDMLGDQIESIVNETKCEASGDGGCVVKIKSEIHTKGDHVVHEEEIKQGNEQSIGMYKAVEAHLQANPAACA